jgi:hypothetical protein
VEASSRLDGRTDDHELRAALRGDACDVLAEAPRPRADDLLPYADAVRACHSGRGLEPLLQAGEPAVHVCVEGQLALDDERSDEDDPGAAIGREPAGEIERVFRLLPVEQGHDDAPVGDRARPAREAPRPAPQQADVRELHRNR